MSFTMAEGRQRVTRELLVAIDQLAIAIACLGTAYERLDEQRADELEERLFRPVQLSYGRAKRTYTDFGERYGLASGEFAEGSAGAESQDARALIERATSATQDADEAIAELQDSMLPVEVGDQELRAGLSQTRELIGPVPGRAGQFVRLLGR